MFEYTTYNPDKDSSEYDIYLKHEPQKKGKILVNQVSRQVFFFFYPFPGFVRQVRPFGCVSVFHFYIFIFTIYNGP